MAVSGASLLRLRDQLESTSSQAMRFHDEFIWARERQIELYGSKNFEQLTAELQSINCRRTELCERLRVLSIYADRRLDSPGFLAGVSQARKDAKAWLKDCEAWLADARVAIPYKIGVDGRPLGKE